ncbi:MAG: signal transduction histidine kinase/ActR/RegA family two-component response regulator [Kiritimatiellia bacterium]|jgi:signal transduction histidine kinase/ActR/RegA family two-component response regulator
MLVHDKNAEKRLQAVDAFARSMLVHHTLDDLLWNIADQVGELLGFDDCVIYMCEGDVLVQAAAFGVKSPNARHIDNAIIIPIGEGIVGSAAQTGVAQYVPDTRQDRRYIADTFQGASELAVPLIFDGEVIGVFDSESELVDGYSVEDQELLQLIAHVASARVAWLRSERLRLASIEQHDVERMESLGLLAAGIAHDFNNLLAVVLLNTEIARAALDGAVRDQALSTVDEAVHRAQGLTKQLSTFANGGAPVRELLEPLGVLTEAVGFVCGVPNIQCELDVRGVLPLLHADEMQLAQVLHNLLLNAAQAMDNSGFIRVVASRCTYEDRAGLQIEVEDDGPGFKVEVLARLFDPFYTTKPMGSGLGLATSYWIVRRHGGVLTAHNRPDGGAMLRVVIPGFEGALGRSQPAAHRPLASIRVLILEDEPLVRRALYALLRSRGHDVDMVEDGADVRPFWLRARRLNTPYDLALLDLQNNCGMGGLEALGELLAVDPSARAVVMSGYTDTKGMHDHRRVGFLARLEKPFDITKLERAFAEALGLPRGE